MIPEKWQLYSQTGVDGPEYGVRIRPGYTVVGFQLEDARQIVAWQNASIQPEGDILDRAKAAAKSLDYCPDFADEQQIILELIAEVEQLRSDRGVWIKHYNDVLEANARITELEAEAQEYHDKKEEALALCAGQNRYIERLEAAFLEAKRCPTCNGAGKLIDVLISRKLGRVESERVCPLCEGKGEEKAREALEQIRSSNHIVEANQMVLTAEQREALQLAIILISPGARGRVEPVIRAMLEGAGGKDE